MPIKSVQKLKLLKTLWENGISLPRKSYNSGFDDEVRKHLFLLLGVDKNECSNATVDSIDKEAVLFQKRVLYHWPKAGFKKPDLEKKDYFLEEITIDVIPIRRDFVPAPPPPPRASGGYKDFEDKSKSGKAADIAAVHDNHAPGAILQAAPRAASELGHPEFATAIRKMATDPEVLPALAIEGMTKKSMYTHYLPVFQRSL